VGRFPGSRRVAAGARAGLELVDAALVLCV
jgi:hypothetical protein